MKKCIFKILVGLSILLEIFAIALYIGANRDIVPPQRFTMIKYRNYSRRCLFNGKPILPFHIWTCGKIDGKQMFSPKPKFPTGYESEFYKTHIFDGIMMYGIPSLFVILIIIMQINVAKTNTKRNKDAGLSEI